MKTNIRKIGLWWKWDEFCDKCGKQIRGNNFSSNTAPNEVEDDYCVDCLRHKLDKYNK